MSNIARVAGQAANTTGKPLDITDVFSTYLYEGNGSTQTITNGIDLAGEGGLVWLKNRGSGNATWHYLFDTERNAGLYSNSTSAEFPATNLLNSFNSDGFTLGGTALLTQSGNNFASWTFRKAEKFFDVVTYTGTGSARTISHNLGSAPGMILIKQTDNTRNWVVYHRSSGAAKHLRLNSTSAEGPDNAGEYWGGTTPTATEFSLGTYFALNQNGGTYVAYLFAHNDGDGGFGPDGDQDIIKCGSYTGTGGDNNAIDIGFEPQWLLTKRTDSTGTWNLVDNMRAFPSRPPSSAGAGGYSLRLSANTSGAESQYWQQHVGASGVIIDSANGDSNASGGTYIYMAIRRGPLAVPEDATEVFAIDEGDGVGAVSAYTSGFPVDFAMDRSALLTQPNYVGTRLLQGTRLQTDGANAEASESAYYFDYMEGWRKFARAAGNYSWMWKRAPGFFDVVAYDGDATAYPTTRDINHNLGVAPEMMWIKCRSFAENWAVYHSGTGATQYLNLNGTSAAATSANWWGNTAPTDTVFTIGHQDDVNANGQTHIAYLFASCPGVSKVGSYTGNGSSQTIDCGFTSGARFVLVRDTTGGNWFLYDSARGITSGSDPALRLNLTNAEVSTTDAIAPNSSGFIVQAAYFNNSGDTYIFYAIA